MNSLETAMRAQGDERQRAALLSRFWRWEASGVMVALLALVLALSLATDNLPSSDNISAVVRQVALVGLVALDQTLVLFVGGIDLSVGAGAGLSSVIGAVALTQWGFRRGL